MAHYDLKTEQLKEMAPKLRAGDTVTLTAAGEGTLTVTDANGKTVALTDLGSGKYTFKMPSAKVSVGFKTTADQPCDGGKDCPSAPFTDVDTAKWYHLSVDYVLAHKMMNGVSSRAFAPNANLTRGMLVQILYNLEGKPKGTAANFSDVQADAWYAEAVGWAASNKVVTGYADGTFRPNAAVTREQAAAILYRYAQSKSIDVSVGENTNIIFGVMFPEAEDDSVKITVIATGLEDDGMHLTEEHTPAFLKKPAAPKTNFPTKEGQLASSRPVAPSALGSSHTARPQTPSYSRQAEDGIKIPEFLQRKR